MSVLKIPAIYGIAAAIIVLATGISVPTALLRPISMLSDAALPLMILVLGMQLERAARPSRPVLVAVAVCVSLVLAPMVALGTHVAARSVRLRSAGGRRAVVDAGRRGDDDPRTGVRHRARFRYERGVSVDDPQPVDADSADCVPAVAANPGGVPLRFDARAARLVE